MRKILATSLTAAALSALLAGCGGSNTPAATASSTTTPTTNPSAHPNAAACSEVGKALTTLSGLARLKHPTSSAVQSRFTLATTDLQTAAGEATAALKTSINEFRTQLSTDASSLRSHKAGPSSVTKDEIRLATSARGIENRCEAVTGGP